MEFVNRAKPGGEIESQPGRRGIGGLLAHGFEGLSQFVAPGAVPLPERLLRGVIAGRAMIDDAPLTDREEGQAGNLRTACRAVGMQEDIPAAVPARSPPVE